LKDPVRSARNQGRECSVGVEPEREVDFLMAEGQFQAGSGSIPSGLQDKT
jgi:hypothetical protein